MKKTFMLLGMILACLIAFSQKPTLEPSVFGKWPVVGKSSISDNGQFCSYVIENRPKGSRTVIVQAINGAFIKKYVGADFGAFTGDGKYVFQRSDTLFIVDLIANKTEAISKVESYQLGGPDAKISWLAHKTVEGSQLSITNFKSGRTIRFSDVFTYTFSKDGSNLLIGTNKGEGRKFDYLNLKNGKTEHVWTANQDKDIELINSFFSQDGNCISLLLESPKYGKTIKIFKRGATKTLDFQMPKQLRDQGYDLSLFDMQFDATAERLFLSLSKEPSLISKNMDLAELDIWSYRDSIYYPSQRLPETKYYTAVLDLKNTKLQILQRDTDLYVDFPSNSGIPSKGEYVLSTQLIRINSLVGTFGLEVIETKTGKRIKIPAPSDREILWPKLSPNEQYVVWYDKNGSYFSYNLKSKKVLEISNGIKSPLFDEEKSSPMKREGFGFSRWLKDDKGILVYDRYDIWLLDPSGEQLPVNVSNGYGRKHRIVLGLLRSDNTHPYQLNEQILISGFNRETKENGFLRIILGKEKEPVSFGMQPYYTHISRTVPYKKGLGGSTGDNIFLDAPIKAKNADIYLVYRMDANASINLFATLDFKSFSPISDNFPEKQYNWLTSELVKFTTLDGKQAKGILYKPENFDRSKKYPVIMTYYEEKSDELHMYIKPYNSISTINIPYFVSNGYLVFIPDIYFEKGHIGKGTLNSIEPARDYLSHLPFVDSTRIGLNGQSFGGYETFFIITHSKKFAAAVGGSGSSNLISSYGQLSHGFEISDPRSKEKGAGNSRAANFEFGQSHMGTTPWDSPDLYIENSPLFSVANITTPLMIWHSKQDGAVPFEQAVELFWAMRHTGKKVWLLQYDNDGHSVSGKNAVDLTERTKQFFDYYLKDGPAPVWMTKGVPLKDKQVITGLEIDNTGLKP